MKKILPSSDEEINYWEDNVTILDIRSLCNPIFFETYWEGPSEARGYNKWIFPSESPAKINIILLVILLFTLSKISVERIFLYLFYSSVIVNSLISSFILAVRFIFVDPWISWFSFDICV